MSWPPNNNPFGGQSPFGTPPGGGGGQAPGGGGHGGAAPATKGAPGKTNFYNLLQVDQHAHPTIIRYAYRFMAGMYHPDNTDTGNAEMFRVISEAWKALSD